MKTVIEKIPTDLYPIIADYAKVLIPSILTYFITRYSLSKPRKYAIKEKQLECVYLPLYLLTKQYILNPSSNISQTLPMYIKKVDKIIYKNYPFVYPKTIKLFDKLKNSQTPLRIDSFQNQVSFDYEKLKRDLGYPSSSLIDTFYRLTPVDKVYYILYLIFLTADIYSFTSAFTLLINGDLINSLSALCVFSVIAVFLHFFGRVITH